MLLPQNTMNLFIVFAKHFGYQTIVEQLLLYSIQIQQAYFISGFVVDAVVCTTVFFLVW